MGSVNPASVNNPLPLVAAAADRSWNVSLKADAGAASDAHELIDFQYQGLRARQELEDVFGEGLIG